MLTCVLSVFHRPWGFKSPNVITDNSVSQYLTNILSPEVYNGLQRGESFDVVVAEDGVNDIIVHSRWPREYGGLEFSAPRVVFVSGRAEVRGELTVVGIEFVATAYLTARVNDRGQLHLYVTAVKLGALDITVPARIVARSMYQSRLEEKGGDDDEFGAKLAAALLDDEPFEPVFEVDEAVVRIKQIAVDKEKLIVSLVPMPD